MEWIQFIIFFIGVFGLFIWNRAESRSDTRHMDAQLKANRDLIFEVHAESMEFRRQMLEESMEFRKQIFEESKNFHGRLCTIEERNKKEKK